MNKYISRYRKFSRNAIGGNAIVSIGIILLKLFDPNLNHIFEKDDGVEINNNGIMVSNDLDVNLFSKIKEQISFLMIRRRHSLGYTEFIRGRYKPENVDGIIFLFQQMTPEEIKKISTMSFEDLWDDFWLDKNKKKTYSKEFYKSEDKFNKLKIGNDTELKLDFYINNVKPVWHNPEWGFPKGRKNRSESDINCAIREFEEETGFKKNEYMLLKNVKPLTEEFIGTNGVRYKHIYYIACMNNTEVPDFPTDSIEIGDIGFYTYDDIIHMIRPYHIERKRIITDLYMYLMGKIIKDINTISKINILQL